MIAHKSAVLKMLPVLQSKHADGSRDYATQTGLAIHIDILSSTVLKITKLW